MSFFNLFKALFVLDNAKVEHFLKKKPCKLTQTC